jgi:GDPmannose 4,6-dehydratase
LTSAPRRALICGISGQDGAYLAELLLGKGYAVTGTSRDVQADSGRNLARLGILDRVRLESMAMQDPGSVRDVLQATLPDEIYNLSGQSSVGLSFELPAQTLDSIVTATVNLLEAIRVLGRPVRFFSAGSGECFGETGPGGAAEGDPLQPRSPYAVAKAAAYWLVANYREAYGLHASTGILFNHESPLRPARFVTRKIIAAACRIARGSGEKLTLGNLGIRRDWGWAPDYVEAMWRMLQPDTPSDFVIATGEANSLEDFVHEVFAELGLDWRQHTEVSRSLYRPTDIAECRGNPGRIGSVLGWQPHHRMRDVIRAMIRAELDGAT